MRALCFLLLWVMSMANPYLARPLIVGDIDYNGDSLVVGRHYKLEWLQACYVIGGDFEEGYPDSWDETLIGGGVLTVKDSAAYRGTYGLEVDGTAPATASAWTNYFGVTAGRAYYAHCMAQRVSGNNGQFECYFYDETYTVMAGSEITTISEVAWTGIGMAFTAPTGATYARLRVTGRHSVLHADDVCLYRGTAATGYTLEDFAPLTAEPKETFTFPHGPMDDIPISDDPANLTMLPTGQIEARYYRHPRQGIKLAFTDLSRAERDQLEQFYWKQHGSGVPFDYVDCDGVSTEVRFAGPLRWKDRHVQDLNDCSFTVWKESTS